MVSSDSRSDSTESLIPPSARRSSVMSLLRLDASIRVDGSASREIADIVEEEWVATHHPGDTVARRHLGVDPLPVAGAGAAAALAGLVFVAVSINVERILRHEGLPERALQTVVLLLGAVVACLFGLIPQSVTALGVELLVGGLLMVGFFAATARRSLRDTRGHTGWLLSRLLTIVPGFLCYPIAGVSLLAGAGGGLRWLAAGIVGAIVGAVINAWVLLVEILR